MSSEQQGDANTADLGHHTWSKAGEQLQMLRNTFLYYSSKTFIHFYHKDILL